MKKLLPMKLIWFATFGAVGLMGASLYTLGPESVPILTAGIPSLLALVGVDRWAAKGTPQ